jgi:hypothetical protein
LILYRVIAWIGSRGPVSAKVNPLEG